MGCVLLFCLNLCGLIVALFLRFGLILWIDSDVYCFLVFVIWFLCFLDCGSVGFGWFGLFVIC